MCKKEKWLTLFPPCSCLWPQACPVPCASCVPVAHCDLGGFENPSNCQWWIYQHTYQGLWKLRVFSGGEVRGAVKQPSRASGFPGMGVCLKEHKKTNFWQIHCSIRYCQRQHPRILRGLKAQQISDCALRPCTLIGSEGRGDFSRNHSLSRHGATKSRMITRTGCLEVLLQKIITIIQLIRIVLFRARVSEHFANSINFLPHPWRRSIIQYNQVWEGDDMEVPENPKILIFL